MKLRPMLQVRDVEASSRWYQGALGLRPGHGGDQYEMLFAAEEFVLQLHRDDAHEHGILQDGAGGVRGAGVSLWFEVVDRDALVAQLERARSAGASVIEDAHWNELAHHYEATLVDPDGYLVVLHGPFEPGA